MVRSSAAVRRPPAPQPSAPAGGLGVRSPQPQPTDGRRPPAIDLNAPPDGDVAVEGDRRRGRGAQSNASGRYEPQARVAFDDGWQSFEELPPFKTTVTLDSTRKIITRNDSPDISFDRSINPYRGCEHGCIYCFARPTHAYLGLSPGLDFETKLFAKPEAPKLLERFGHPVGIVTKSALVVRDLDILARMAKRTLVKVGLSVTTLDPKLARLMEPRAATPARRLDALRQLTAAGVPASVMVAPVIPALNDAEI